MDMYPVAVPLNAHTSIVQIYILRVYKVVHSKQTVILMKNLSWVGFSYTVYVMEAIYGNEPEVF